MILSHNDVIFLCSGSVSGVFRQFLLKTADAGGEDIEDRSTKKGTFDETNDRGGESNNKQRFLNLTTVGDRSDEKTFEM